MKTNIDIPSLTQACKHIYRYSQQIPQAWTHPFTSTLKYCYITYCKTWKSSQIHSHKCFCCCSVTQSCLTFCGPMDRSTPGFPVLFHLPEFAHSCPLSRWCHPTISPSATPSPVAFSISQDPGLFQWAGSSHQVARVLKLQLQHQLIQIPNVSSDKDTRYHGLGPIPITSFNLDYLFTGLITKYCHIRGP